MYVYRSTKTLPQNECHIIHTCITASMYIYLYKSILFISSYYYEST